MKKFKGLQGQVTTPVLVTYYEDNDTGRLTKERFKATWRLRSQVAMDSAESMTDREFLKSELVAFSGFFWDDGTPVVVDDETIDALTDKDNPVAPWYRAGLLESWRLAQTGQVARGN